MTTMQVQRADPDRDRQQDEVVRHDQRGQEGDHPQQVQPIAGHRTEDRVQSRARSADGGLEQRFDEHACLRVGCRIRIRQTLRNPVHLGLGLGEVHTPLEPGHGEPVVAG